MVISASYRSSQNWKIIYFAFFVFCFNHLSAQTINPHSHHISTIEGLSNNNITCIEQDKYGFIWIGTQEGLNRYNGYENKVFKKQLNDSSSLIDNVIIDTYIDHENNLWVGTLNGICLFNEDTEDFTTKLLDQKRININTANRVTKITEDSQNKLIASVELGKIFYYNRKTSDFEVDSNDFISIRDLAIDDDDNIWIGGDHGIKMYNRSKGLIKEYSFYQENNRNHLIPPISTLFIEGDTVWIGTMNGKIFYILRNEGTIKQSSINFLSTHIIYEIIKTSDGEIYISTTSGLHTLNKETNEITKFNFKQDDNVKTTAVFLAFEDSQKNLWVGVAQDGVYTITKGKPFRNYNLHSEGITLDQLNIKSAIEDHKGNLWIGSYNEGINKINPITNQRKFYTHSPHNPRSISFGTVHFLYQDSKNIIWTGTYTGPLQQYDSINDCFISHNINVGTKENPKWVRDIRSMIEDDEGNFWLVAHSFGLIKYNTSTKTYKRLIHEDNNNESLADNWPFCIIKGVEGFFWIGTPSGLSRLNPKTEEFKNYYKSDIDSNGLYDNYINTLFEDSNNNLWIGTNYGLDLFDREKNNFYHFFEKHGLPSNQISGILEHEPGELWITTPHGLSRLRYEYNNKTGAISTEFKNYSKYDNLQDEYYWPNSGCKLKNGELLIGGENGITIFDPNEIKDNLQAPKVYITDFKLFYKSVKVGQYDSLLTQHIIKTDKIELNHDQNYIGFSFVAMNYLAKSKNKFKYKLEGLDDDWISLGNKREASYTNLDPGVYTFRVIASNNDDIWNTKGASIKIIIHPPFWATTGFIILIIFVILSTIVSLVYYRFNQFKQQNLRLEQRVRSRTAELEELNEELTQMNKQIIQQNHEIKEQADVISAKGEEIFTQNETLEKQKNEIEKAYDELKIYRTQLEQLVENRTRELVKSKEKAEEADRLKTSFLTNMSHEIRTPLNAIIGFSQFLIEQDCDEDEKQEFKNIIEINSQSLLSLINDIIDFSEIESGQVKIYKTKLEISNIFDHIWDIYNQEKYKIQADKNNKVDFIVKGENSSKQIILYSDELRIKQVLSILINNSLKFTKEGFVEVGYYLSDNNEINFYVKDSGIGIRPEDQEVIFKRFRKLEKNKKTLYRGTGLGLSISKHIVKLIGGKIWVDSEPGKGSTFTFSLPLDEKDIQPKKELKVTNENTEAIPDLTGKNILIAEDNYSNFLYLKKLLKSTHANIIHAKNGKEAVDLVDSHKNIDLILMDIKMPVLDGMDALQEIIAKNYSIPTIAQTAYAFTDEIHRIKSSGFDDYISKPIQPKKIYSLITKYFV